MVSEKTEGRGRRRSAKKRSAEALRPRPRRRAGPRTWLARAAALVAAPLLFLAVFELVLRLAGFGYPTRYFLPGSDGHELLSNPRFSWRFFGPELARSPVPQVVPDPKPAGTYRIIVLGASAARGEPNPAFSFGRILEAMLNETYAGTRFEVVNTGMTAINSHIVLPIARECSRLKGDLCIVYLGNNEVVGPYGPGSVFKGFSGSIGLIRANLWLRATRLGQLMVRIARSAPLGGGGDEEAWGGMAMFRQNAVPADDPRLETVYANYRRNLRDIFHAAADGGARVIVSTVLTNLKDQAPLMSVHRPGLPAAQEQRWETLVGEGRSREEAGDHDAAIARFRAAEGIDDGYAELHFLLGRALLARGDVDSAAAHLVRARDLDALRFRADTRINGIIREAVAAARGTVDLADVEQAAWSSDDPRLRIPGFELLYEHVHMTFAGNYFVAATLFDRISRLLPPQVKRSNPRASGPPPIQRCARILLYTPYDRAADARKVLQITGKPPFSPEQGAADRERADRLAGSLTGDLLANLTQAYEQALNRRPDDLLMRSDYADLLYSRSEFGPAAAQWRRLLGRYPPSSDWNFRLASALSEAGRPADAIPHLHRALALSPGRASVRVRLASVLLKSGRTDDAVDELHRALAIRPDDVTSNLLLGRVLLQRRRPGPAREHFVKAVARHPDSKTLYYELGRAFAGGGGGMEPIPLDAVPLECALELVHGLARLPVEADWPALAGVGVTPATPVDLTLSGRSGPSVFQDILARLGGRVTGAVADDRIVFGAAATSP